MNKKIKDIRPRKDYFATENDLQDDFCYQVCGSISNHYINEGGGEDGCYGCELMEDFMEKYANSHVIENDADIAVNAIEKRDKTIQELQNKITQLEARLKEADEVIVF